MSPYQPYQLLWAGALFTRISFPGTWTWSLKATKSSRMEAAPKQWGSIQREQDHFPSLLVRPLEALRGLVLLLKKLNPVGALNFP